MKRHDPAPRPETSHPRREDTLESFEIRVPRWPLLVRLVDRGPLVRTTDRVEAFVVTLAIVVSLLAIPVAAAVGTATYDSRSRFYAEQHAMRQQVTATVTDVPESVSFSRTGMITVPVEWWDGDTRRTDTVQAHGSVDPGDAVDLWVGEDGAQVLAPEPTSRAAVEAVAGAVAIWMSVAAGTAILSALVQLTCDRIRSAAWQHELDTLVDGGGHTSSHP
ncbi:hypothetical protein AU195_17660 [Mycobacterium sp. IS-1496]|uniref:Rv1733c family protein n=1 Tax=Mycobacterium sp. IS-1496 TaxID=1772284 RepID=UPI0007415370|nr:hypothetical protein [Mycobacterium sp. IS-1496]KUI23093.1 hypothetical protein AU195_17660 [Mycobacterium sp. IS-1496]